MVRQERGMMRRLISCVTYAAWLVQRVRPAWQLNEYCQPLPRSRSAHAVPLQLRHSPWQACLASSKSSSMWSPAAGFAMLVHCPCS